MSKVQVDKVVNLSDDGAPQLTYGAELPVGYGLTGAGGLNISGVVTAASAVFSGNVTIGGTLTYEDVTNVDVVGVSTFAGRMNVNSTINANEGIKVVGVSTLAAVTGTTGTFSGAVSGTTGTFSSDVKTTAGTVNVKSGSSINTNSDTSAHGALHKNTTSGEFAIVSGGTGGNNYLSFYTSASAAPTEKLRIASDGDVIIGGSSAAGYADYADNLTIHDTENSGITIRSGIASQGAIYFSDATGSGTGTYVGNIIYDHSDNHMRFATSASEAVRIDSSGRLLIGTTTEGHAAADNLTVADTGNSGITIRSGTSNNGALYFSDGESGSAEYKGAVRYSHSDNALDFYTNGSTRLLIDSDGAVNIGSSPAQATGTHTANAILTAKGYPGDETSAAILALVRGNNTTSTASGHTLGRIVFSDKQAGEYALIEGESEHAAAVGDTPGRLIFATTSDGATTPSEKVRIDMNGDVIVHGTSLNNSAVAGQALQINGTTRPTLILRGNASGSNTGEIQFADNSGSDDDNTGIRAGLIQYDHSTNAMSFRVAGTYTGLKISGTNGRLERNFTGGSNTDDDGMWFNNSGSTSGTYIRFWQTTSGANQIGSISHTTSATSFNTSSDYRLKENAVGITSAITRLKTLKPYRFNFKTDASTTVDGFFAHEVTTVPEAITGTKDEVDSNGDPIYQGIDQSKLVPLLTAALQEAIAKIETLETKVAALESS